MSYINKEEATGLCAALYVNRKDNHEFDAGARYAAKQLLSLIKNLPDADVVERKRGKWIDTGSGQECSLCNEIQYGYDNFRHFCPNCGAYMREIK